VQFRAVSRRNMHDLAGFQHKKIPRFVPPIVPPIVSPMRFLSPQYVLFNSSLLFMQHFRGKKYGIFKKMYLFF